MSDSKTNDKYKDALFRIIFGDYKENALSLYNAINGSDYTDVSDLMITILKDALFISIKNDVSFLFNNDMSLYEHQSTLCPNIPLRGLGYFADLYQMYLGGVDKAAKRMYSDYPVSIPAPRFYVFYNGKKWNAERKDLYLSDLYDGDGDIEVVAHMINVNSGHNKEIMDRCKPLADYAELVKRIRDNLDQGFSKEEAVRMAIDSCIADGILEDILRKERARVVNSLIRGLTEEEVKELREWEIEHSYELGLEKGLEKGHIQRGYEAVDLLVDEGTFGAEKACETLKVDFEDYKKWKAEMGK